MSFSADTITTNLSMSMYEALRLTEALQTVVEGREEQGLQLEKQVRGNKLENVFSKKIFKDAAFKNKDFLKVDTFLLSDGSPRSTAPNRPMGLSSKRLK